MELVDVPDSKSGVGNYVPVRPRPSADINRHPTRGVYLCLDSGVNRRGRTGTDGSSASELRLEQFCFSIKNTETKCEIAVKRERARHPGHRQIFKTPPKGVFL